MVILVLLIAFPLSLTQESYLGFLLNFHGHVIYQDWISF